MPQGRNEDRRIGRRAFCVGLGAAAALPAAWPARAAEKAASKAVADAAAKTAYPDMIGRMGEHVTIEADTLLDLARHYGLGYVELVAANPGVDPWIPGAGIKVTLPTAHLLPTAERKGVVLNLGDQRLYHFRESGQIDSFPVGVGAEGWNTPLGTTKVVRKAANPAWHVPKSIRERDPELPAYVPPGPNNPLGTHALYLGWPSYLIHGTNKPDGVGRRVSHGCVRMYPEGIKQLFQDVAVGTQVTVVNQDVKFGWVGDELMMEVHPNQAQADELEATGEFTPADPPEIDYKVLSAAGQRSQDVDWPTVRKLIRERAGFPVAILKQKPTAEAASTRG